MKSLHGIIAAAAMMMVSGTTAQPAHAREPRETHIRLLGEKGEPELFLRHLPPEHDISAPHAVRTPMPPVLYVHGATFPSGLSVAFKFDGISWMDELSRAGFDVWAFDFAGYGESERYPETRGDEPIGRAEDAARQIARVAGFITRETGAPRISLIAHSWGTIPTGLFAGRHPERVERLVLFGPIAERQGEAKPVTNAWHHLTVAEQHARFVAEVPAGESPVLLDRHFTSWGPAYLASDRESTTRTPPSVKVPSGPVADIADAWAGRLAYDPAKIKAPVAIIRGEWDTLTTDADARWLFDAMKSSPMKRDVKISRATHLMHLEENRRALYHEAEAFLRGEDRQERTQ